MGCARELVLRARVGLIHAVVRGGAGPVGGRQLRPDPTGRGATVRRTELCKFVVEKAGRTGEAKQSELVGMTAVAETGTIAVTIATNYLTVASSSEGSMSFETEE